MGGAGDEVQRHRREHALANGGSYHRARCASRRAGGSEIDM
jgi:hypothetical protein